MKALIILGFLVSVSCSVIGQDTISAAQAKDFVGKKVTLCDRVNYGKFLNINKNAPTLLYVGPDHPNHYFILYIPHNRVKRFSFDPEKKMINKRFCVTGRMKTYESKPAIYVRRESQLNVEEVNSYIYDYDEKQKGNE